MVQLTQNSLTQDGSSYHMKRQGRKQEKADEMKIPRSVRGECWGQAVVGEEERYTAVFPDVAAVAWLSAAFKMTAYTLHLKNSSSDNLFSWDISSSVVFPRPQRPAHHSLRLLVSLTF